LFAVDGGNKKNTPKIHLMH